MRTLLHTCLVALAACLPATSVAAASPEARTLTAWTAYVEATEARMRGELVSSRGFLASDFTGRTEDLRRQLAGGSVVVGRVTTSGGDGRKIEVPGGTVQHWRGAVFLPGVALASLAEALRHPPEHGPYQENVIAMRVERRFPSALDLYIRMSRASLVTVTYDTEHHVEFTSWGVRRLSTRSVATRITEIDRAGTPGERPLDPDDEHGFLWRMNSYWRYEQVDGGVIAEMESLTLSRDIPYAVRFLVDPLVDRVARESVERTLRSFRDLYVGRLI